MAVIPGTSNPVPDSGNTSDLGGVSWMQDVTEGSVRQNAYNQVFPSMRGAKESLLGNLLGGFFGVMTGIFTGAVSIIPSWFPQSAADYANAIRDGQIDLNDRTDLLSPLLDYRSVSTPPSGSDAMHGSGRIPFDFQIGPFQGVSKEPSMLILDDKGLWDLRAQVTASYMNNPLAQQVKVWLRVLRPDGSVFSQQAHYAETMNSVTIPIVSSVCVPEAGYKVDVWVWAQSGSRGWWSGPEWTRLTVQHISREVENGTGGESSTIPAEPEAEG